MGVGAMLREPGRQRNRLFGIFCAALALWNLAKAAEPGGLDLPVPWRIVYLFGACAAVSTGLHFLLVVVRPSDRQARRLVPWAYAVSAALWGSAWTPAYGRQPAWNVAALVILGGLVLIGLWILLRHMGSLPQGLHRNAARLLLAGALVGGLGALSDLLPRGPDGPIKIGPAAILVLLLIVSGVLLRHRFLDVETFLSEVLAMVVGALLASLALRGVILLVGGGLLPLFVVMLLLIVLRGPVWKALLSGVRSLMGAGDPVAQALVAVSRELPRAREPTDLWKAIDDGLRRLPGNLRVDIYLRGTPVGPFAIAYRSDAGPASLSVETDDALPRLLAKERAPVTRQFLEMESEETWGERREQAIAALGKLRTLETDLAVPLLRGGVLAGWIGIGGERLRHYPWAELAAAFLAVGNQALASLDRIEAQAESRRREALAAVGEMAAGLAHEVRNPLGAIRGAAQILTAGADPVKSGEMLEVIEEETGRLGRVVGEFLDYARPAPVRREPVDVADLARQVLRSAAASGLSLRTDLQVKADVTRALGDPDQLQRAFANLVRNAGEAAGPDGLLRVEVGRDGSGRITIRFEDNGPGIPPDQMTRLFQPFHTTKPGGTGLGLALVHRVIEAHGGEVRVDGRRSLGAAFTIALPAAGGSA
jgi:signal transduction histidine kinase